MSNNTGGPAFPVTIENGLSAGGDRGMTLRDYFAAKALPISYQFWMIDYYHPDAVDAEMRVEDDRGDFDKDMKTLVAETAYELADAMMEARNAAQ
jgi:hypothetical protein